MNRSTVTLLAFMGLLRSVAQPTLPVDARVDLNPGYRNVLRVEGQFDFNANTLLNELPLALYGGGYLEREVRQRSADGLRNKGNSAGYIIVGSVQWTGASCWEKHPRWRPHIKLSHHDLAGLSFTADQYNIAFFGNAAYEGRTAALAPSAFEQVRYQSIGGGVLDDATGSYVRLDLLRGQSFTALDAEWATLYTGEDGRVFRSAVLGDYTASDTAGRGIDRTNGLGAAISARWNVTTKGEKPVRISVGVDHLGFIAWNDRTVNIAKDTLIRFEGWHVENLFALDDVIVNDATVLDTLGLRYQHGTRTRLSPFRLYAEAYRPLTDRWQAGVALEHRHLPGYIPRITALVSRMLGQRTMLAGTLGYGGFGSLQLGVSAKHRMGEHVLLMLSTPQLPALVSDRARGLGLVFGCSLGF